MSEYQQERKGFWYEPEGTSTNEAIALDTWARVAHDVLEEVAAVYHDVVTEAAFAERIQWASGIHTTRPPDRWLRKLLAPLAVVHHQHGHPPLTALVVDARGWVGERYEDLLLAVDARPIVDPKAREQHAARARLECYQWAGSAPEGGGFPAEVPTGRVRTARASSPRTPRAPGAPRAAKEPKTPAAPKRVAASDKPITVCPRCFMAMPATGLCDNCD
ncbi:MAG: hypothetical protein WB767_16920 [Nocardioides sp.]